MSKVRNINGRSRRPPGGRRTPAADGGPAADRVAELVRDDRRLRRASDLVADASRACPRHGPDFVVEVPLRAVEGFSRFGCSKCGIKLGIGPTTEAGVRRWADGYILTFGRHRGRLLSELAASPTTRSYVGWVATLDNDAASAARILLGPQEASCR